jgi:hypothetical protein
MAVDYWRDRAHAAEYRKMELDSQLTQARCRAGRVSAENVAIALAAHELLDTLGDRPGEAVAPLAANLRTALDGAYTRGMNGTMGNAVNLYLAMGIIREMLKRMKTGEKLTRAAVKWATEQMLRKRIDLASIPRWAIGGS